MRVAILRMRTGISIKITRPDRRRLEAITKDRNSSQKHAWRAAIVLLSVDGIGTNEIMRQTGTSKTCVWRWQQRFMEEGVEGLLRDKTRPSRIAGFGPEVAERVLALTLADPPTETTHWTADLMAGASGISASTVRRIWKAQGSSLIGADSSSSPTIRTSSPSCATLSGSMSTRRPTPSCCRSTKRAKFRPSIAPSRVSR